MFSNADYLPDGYDQYLVLVAGVICALGSFSTVVAAGRVHASRGTRLWPILFAVCTTSTVWATHFVAMMAFRTDLPSSYALVPTVLSYVIAFALNGATLYIVPRLSAQLWPVGYGIGLGLGIAALHYIGMSAVRIPGHIAYDPWFVAASVALGCGLATLTISRLYKIRTRSDWLTVAALFATTILVLHFVGMEAVTLVIDTRVIVPPGLSPHALAGDVAAAGLSVALITLFGASLDNRASHKLAREAARFRTLADGAIEGLIIHREGAIIDMNVAARTLFISGGSAAVRLESLFVDGLDPAANPTSGEVEMLRTDGTRVPVQMVRRPILASDGGQAELLAIRDLTVQKQAEKELASALEDVGKLRELIPMCAWCKSIRHDTGFWNSVDEYISRLTGNQITHGSAPRAMSEL